MMNKLAAALFALTTAGCATENDGALHLTGRLVDPAAVTHVIATNPETGERVIVDMKADGNADGHFDVALPPGGAWIVTFANALEVGAAMRVATLQTAGIDAFPSQHGGTLDFGDVHFSKGRAHGKLTWAQLTGALGYDQATLVTMGQQDDLALRYANPDIDGDGKLDALQDRRYVLELAGRFTLQQDGRDVDMADVTRGIADANMRYMGTTIQSSLPRGMGMQMESGTMLFDEPFWGTALGVNTKVVMPGTPIGHPHIKFGERDGNPAVGVVAHPDHDAPRGTYRFGFDNGTLTFTDVLPPSVHTMWAPTDVSVPFLRIRPAIDGCVIDCDIGALELAWKRATGDGWQAAPAPRDAHLDILTRFNGREAYLAADLEGGATSLPWSAMPLRGTGLVRNELSYISTSEICYVAISYQSELGMKLTNVVQNPACF